MGERGGRNDKRQMRALQRMSAAALSNLSILDGDGISFAGSTINVDLKDADPGLFFGTTGLSLLVAAGQPFGLSGGLTLALGASGGLEVVSAAAQIKLAPASALSLSGDGLAVDQTAIEVGVGNFDTDVADAFGILIGMTLDHPEVTVASDGTTIALSVEQNGGGDIRYFFSDGVHTVDTTPAVSVPLTAGTDTVPVLNYIYLLAATDTYTANTSGWPTAEHSAVATVLCPSASSAQTEGVYKTHVWTNSVSNPAGGHLADVNFWVRQQPATWDVGMATTPTVGVLTFDLAISAGAILQLHAHDSDAVDTSTGDDLLVVNDSAAPYTHVSDLTSAITDAAGDSLSGRYYNLVVWRVVSETNAASHTMINLPVGSYGNATTAAADADATAVYSIPRVFRGTAVLLSRITVRHQTGGGGTWTLIQNEDLRGLAPGLSAGTTSGVTLNPTASGLTLAGGLAVVPGSELEINGSNELNHAYPPGRFTDLDDRTTAASLLQVDAGQLVIIDSTTSGSQSIRLPDPSLYEGESVTIKVAGDDAIKLLIIAQYLNDYTGLIEGVAANAGGTSFVTAAVRNQCFTMTSDGEGWWFTGNHLAYQEVNWQRYNMLWADRENEVGDTMEVPLFTITVDQLNNVLIEAIYIHTAQGWFTAGSGTLDVDIVVDDDNNPSQTVLLTNTIFPQTITSFTGRTLMDTPDLITAGTITIKAVFTVSGTTTDILDVKQGKSTVWVKWGNIGPRFA